MSWKRQPRAWKRVIRLAHRKSVLQETTAAEVRQWHAEILRILGANGAVIEGQVDRGPPQPALHVCPSCPRSFSTVQGLTSHRRFAHGYVAPESNYVKNAVCPHCLKFLWSKARVRQRLAYAPRDGSANKCYVALRKRGYDPEEDPEPDPTYGATAGINRRDALQACGPAVEEIDQKELILKEMTLTLERVEVAFEKKYNVEQVSLFFAETTSRVLAEVTAAWFEEGTFRHQTESEAVTTTGRLDRGIRRRAQGRRYRACLHPLGSRDSTRNHCPLVRRKC